MQAENARHARATSEMPIFPFFLLSGNIKNANRSAKPRCIALAGNPLKRPTPNMNGNGEAYQSWNNDHIIAIAATIFKCNPERLRVGDKSS